MVPPAQRRKLASSVAATKEWGWWGVTGLAKTAWVISVSAIMLGVPFASAYAEEQMYAEEEKRRKMAESSNDVSREWDARLLVLILWRREDSLITDLWNGPAVEEMEGYGLMLTTFCRFWLLERRACLKHSNHFDIGLSA